VSPLILALAVHDAEAGAPIATGAPPPRAVPVAGKPRDGRVDLVVTTADARCRFDRQDIVERDGGTVKVVLGLLGDALAAWVAEQGEISAVPADGSVPPCDLPGVDVVLVPSGGWAIGVHHGPSEVRVDGPVTIRPLGDDEQWWYLVANEPGEAQLAFLHERAPPTRLRLVLDPGAPPPEGEQMSAARRGAATKELESSLVAAALEVDGVASLVPLGRHLVAIGHETGRADGVVREAGQPPYPIAVVVLPDLPAPAGLAYTVRPGSSRRLRPDVEVAGAISADPETVAVEWSPRRLVLEAGDCPETCEADVVLLDTEGKTHIVRVVVH